MGSPELAALERAVIDVKAAPPLQKMAALDRLVEAFVRWAKSIEEGAHGNRR